MLEATVKKRRLRLFGHSHAMQGRLHVWHCPGFLMKREIMVDHASRSVWKDIEAPTSAGARELEAPSGGVREAPPPGPQTQRGL